MSVIDQLIQIKKQTSNEDIIHVMDELVKYEKLVKLPAFQDIANQAAIQKKIPFLWKAMQHDLYAQTLLTMAGHICRHLTGETPAGVDAILDDIDGTHQRRLELMQSNTITVLYYSLADYDHATMENNVVAIYSTKNKHNMALLIVTYWEGEYRIFQGYYTEKDVVQNKTDIPCYTCKKDNYELNIQTYSPQGNNTYPFGVLLIDNTRFTVCMPVNDNIYLQRQQTHEDAGYVDDANYPSQGILLTPSEQNNLVMNLPHVEDFAPALLNIIYEKVQGDHTAHTNTKEDCV